MTDATCPLISQSSHLSTPSALHITDAAFYRSSEKIKSYRRLSWDINAYILIGGELFCETITIMKYRLNLQNPFLSLITILLLAGITSYGMETNPLVNQWSLSYLWSQEDNIAAERTWAGTPPPFQHTNGHIWIARNVWQQGATYVAMQLLQPALNEASRDAYLLQADIMTTQDQYDEAISIWTKLGETESLLAAGHAAVRDHYLTRAMAAFQAAYLLAPEQTVRPLSHFLWHDYGDVATAEALLRKFIMNQPNSRYRFNWLRELGDLYQTQEAWEQAIAIYEELVRQSPERSEDWLTLGWLYYEHENRTELALQTFQQAVALTPNTGSGYYAIATLFERENQLSEADTWYALALEREPAQQWWWLNRAMTAQEAGNELLAQQLYREIQQQFPEFAAGHYQAAWIWRQAGKPKEAMAAIEQAVQLIDLLDNSKRIFHAGYYTSAGQIYEWGGEPQKAIKAYEQALQLNPQEEQAVAGLDRLYGKQP